MFIGICKIKLEILLLEVKMFFRNCLFIVEFLKFFVIESVIFKKWWMFCLILLSWYSVNLMYIE